MGARLRRSVTPTGLSSRLRSPRLLVHTARTHPRFSPASNLSGDYAVLNRSLSLLRRIVAKHPKARASMQNIFHMYQQMGKPGTLDNASPPFPRTQALHRGMEAERAGTTVRPIWGPLVCSSLGSMGAQLLSLLISLSKRIHTCNSMSYTVPSNTLRSTSMT